MSQLESDLASFMAAQYQPVIDILTKPSHTVTVPDPRAFSFCSDSRTGLRIEIDPSDLSTSLVMLGASKSGKSNGLRAIGEQLIYRKRWYGEGFTLVDIHGNLARWMRDASARHLPLLSEHFYFLDLRQLERVLLIDPLRHGEGESFSVAQSVTEAFLRAYGAGDSTEKPLVARMFSKLGQALRDLGIALTEARFFLCRSESERAVFRSLLQKLPPGELRAFWESHDKLGPSQADMYTLGVANRTDSVTNVLALRRMFGHTAAALDFKKAMDEGYVVICDLSREGTDVTLDAQTLVASLIVECFNQVIESRTPDTSLPHTLVLDECGQYLTPTFARSIVTMRKFACRAVLAGQGLSQFVPRDQDRTLLDTIMAIPSKIIFGGLPFDQAKLLAEQIFLPMLDPMQIKFQPTSIAWDPKPTLVTLHGGSRGGGSSETRGTGTARSRNSGRSQAMMQPDAGDGGSRSEGDSDGESESTSEQYSFSRQETWGESWQEAYVTLYEKRVQNLPPMFSSLEEQVFCYAQKMNLSRQGTAILALPGCNPREVRFAHMIEVDLSDLERRRFMAMVYGNSGYLDPTEALRTIDDRQAKLIEAAPVPPKPKPKQVRRGQAFLVKEEG